MLTDATVASLMVTLVMRVVTVRTGRVTGMKMGSVMTHRHDNADVVTTLTS